MPAWGLRGWELLHLWHAQNRTGFWKVWFHFLLCYECIVLKSVHVLQIYEDRCINNFGDVGFSAFASLIPNCRTAMAWPYLTLVVLSKGIHGYPGVICGDEILGRSSQIEKVNHALLSECHTRFFYAWVFIYAKKFKEPTHLFREPKLSVRHLCSFQQKLK